MTSSQPGTPDATRPRGHRGRGGILTGGVLIAIGILFLLHNLDMVDLEFTWHAWPLFLVLFGVVRCIERSDRSSGLWLIAIGLWLYANENHVWGLDYDNSWPFFLVFGGFMMVAKALRRNEAGIPERPSGPDTPREGGTR